MQKPPPDFRTNFEATHPPILIDNGLAILENDKIERHIMKSIPGGYNLFVQVSESESAPSENPFQFGSFSFWTVHFVTSSPWAIMSSSRARRHSVMISSNPVHSLSLFSRTKRSQRWSKTSIPSWNWCWWRKTRRKTTHFWAILERSTTIWPSGVPDSWPATQCAASIVS